MTEALLQNSAPRRVLEIGTGSGYQTAVLASLIEQVYSVERIGALLSQARQRLAKLELTNIQFRLGDGYEGWTKHAPFDAILVAAAPEQIPAGLLAQLADGGNLVIPFGKNPEQRLTVITRMGEEFIHRPMDWVSFVPLVKGMD